MYMCMILCAIIHIKFILKWGMDAVVIAEHMCMAFDDCIP